MSQRLAAVVAAATLGLTLWPTTSAVAGTGNPYDIFYSVPLDSPPIGYPSGRHGYFVRPDATNWGSVGQMLPGGLADGRGQNVAPAANASGCIPAPTETPADSLISYSAARLEAVCVLHPGDVAFQVGDTRRGKNRDGFTYYNDARVYLVRYSQTSDCLFPVGDVSYKPFPKESLVVRTTIPADKVGLYMCVTQGFRGNQKEQNLVGADIVRSYNVRGPWTVFHVVAAGASDKPTQVVATPGNAQASVTWEFTGDQIATTTFTATSNPAGGTCRVVALKTCTVTGLRNGVAYTFTVTAERNGLRQTSVASAAVTPVDPAAPGGANPNAGGNAANAQPLGASRVIVTPVNSNDVKPLGAVEVTAPLSGALAAGQRITNRFVLACFVANRGDGCGDERRRLELRPEIDLQKVRVWIPSSAAGKFLRLTQTVVTSTGAPSSPAVYSLVTRQPAVGQALVDPPAGADPNAAVPQQVGEAAAVPADAGAPNAPAEAGAPNPGAAAPAVEAPAAAPVDAGALGALASAARVNVEVAPIVNTEGEGANGSQSLKVTIPAVQKKNTRIPLSATLSPKAAGTITFTLTRVTPKGKWIVGKVKTATVNARGKASSKWVLEPKKPAGAYTVVASFVPTQKGAPGVTVTKAITVQ